MTTRRNTQTHKRTLNKTMAIALAAGLSFSSVQVVSAYTGHDLAGQAVAAEAGMLDPSVIKSHSIIADKSKTAITTKNDTFTDAAGRDAFINKHGTNVNFDVNMEIPDKAKSGDSIAFKIGGAFVPNMKDGNGVDVHAKGNNGEDFVIGAWKYNDAAKIVTFTLSKDASEYQDRRVHIQFPMRITPLVIDTGDEADKGKAVPKKGTVTLASTGDVLDEFAYEAPYIYKGSEGNIIHYQDDTPLKEENGYFLDDLTPNINTGEFHGRIIRNKIGFADPSNDFNVMENSERPLMWGKYSDETGTHYLDPNSTRDVSVEYTLDNPNFKFAEDDNTGWILHYPGAEKPIIREKDGKKLTYLFDPDKQKSFQPNEVKNGTFEKETGVKYSVEISDDGQKAVLHYKNVKVIDGLATPWPLRIKGDFTPGDKFTVNGKFVDGVGTPHEAYHYGYTDNVSFTYTMPESFDDGSGKKIVKSAEMKAFVNGNDANDEKSAEKITANKAQFSINLKNTGTIGATKATVKYPKGVTDAKGKTERVFDFGENGFAPGSTKTLDLGELTVAKGAQKNNFTVTMNGFESMSDPAWTTTPTATKPVDPTWGNTTVPDGETKKIPAGGGAKNAPKGTKYELTGNHPTWITINPNTGEITAKPPKGTNPGKNTVTVTTTFPDGSKDTDKPVITVTHTPTTAEPVDPNWGNTEVPDGGTKKIPAGGGAKNAPKGTKYELTGDHPDWITINPTTGEITAKPPKGTKPGKNQVTVTTTFPDGSKDTDKPVITVTHTDTPDTPETTPTDIYIDGKPDVSKDGTVTLHRNDGKDITFKVPTGSTVEVNKDGDLVITQPDGTTKTVPLKHTTVTEQGKPGTPDHKIIITDENGNTHEFGTYDKFLESINDDGKGAYTFIMNDGTKLGPIQLGDDIVNITDGGNGNLVITHKDGSTDTVPLKHTTIVESGTPGDKDYSVTITTPDGKTITLDAYDNYVESIEKQDNGDYLVTRRDGTTWTIELADIRRDIADLKGKDAEQDKRLDDLENRINGIDTKITNLGDRITHNEGAIEDHNKAIDDLTKEIGSINTELGDIKTELARLDGQDIKEVRDNGDGTYTLIRNNGEKVTGTIDTSGTITAIADNGDGTITLTKTDGSTENVELSHTKVETSGQPGDTDYTITITTPNGNSVTINAFDVYVTDVIRNDEGNYDIFRSDVDGGKTVWKTIILSDIRDQIAHLEDRADQLENKDEDLQRQIDELKKYLDTTEQEIQALKSRTTDLEKAVTAINAQLDVIKLTITALDTRIATLEGRVTTVEDTQRAWAQCYNGIKGAALPLLAILPLLAASNVQIPGVAEWNNNIQRTLGIYNKDLSRMASQYSGIAGVVATVLGVLGAIGLYNHAATACEPYSQTNTPKEDSQ